jgi:osmotically-inducible protein OsmY
VQAVPSAPAKAALKLSEVKCHVPDSYVIARIKDALTHDIRSGDQEIKVMVDGMRVLLLGEVVSEEHRRNVEEVVRESAPEYRIDNHLKVAVLTEPEGAEAVR